MMRQATLPHKVRQHLRPLKLHLPQTLQLHPFPPISLPLPSPPLKSISLGLPPQTMWESQGIEYSEEVSKLLPLLLPHSPTLVLPLQPPIHTPSLPLMLHLISQLNHHLLLLSLFLLPIPLLPLSLLLLLLISLKLPLPSPGLPMNRPPAKLTMASPLPTATLQP